MSVFYCLIMCIILTEDANPSSTRLVNVPVKLGGKSQTLLLYTNDLEVRDTNNTSKDCDELMIVAIPNENNQQSFGLVDVTTENMTKFRKDLFEACDNLKPKKKKGMWRGRNMDFNDEYSIDKLVVHNIGNYKISVAPSIDDLFNRTDWEEFNVGPSYKNRLDGLYDKNVYPLSNYAYVIAQAQKSVKDDGFGIIYDGNGKTYFPTSHESKYPHENMRKFQTLNPDKNIEIPKSDPDEKYSYDVKCYNCFVTVNDDYIFKRINQDINRRDDIDSARTKNIDILRGRPLVLTNNNLIDNIFSNLDKSCTISDDGASETFEIDQSGGSQVDFIELKNYNEFDNINIGWSQESTIKLDEPNNTSVTSNANSTSNPSEQQEQKSSWNLWGFKFF